MWILSICGDEITMPELGVFITDNLEYDKAEVSIDTPIYAHLNGF